MLSGSQLQIKTELKHHQKKFVRTLQTVPVSFAFCDLSDLNINT